LPGHETPKEQRIIFHVDIDSFYPSVEVRESPVLKGRPVVVGADPKEGRGRGVVVSCSYEARKLGVRAGQPISRAFRISPDAVYLRPNFALYSKVSRNVMNLLRGKAERFEQVSIDEAFLDVSGKVSSFEQARSLALQIKQDVEVSEGLTCSVGVAPNKSSAKIASEFQKPDGLTVVQPDRLKDFLAVLPVSAITGIGDKTEKYLESIGVKSIGDLQKMDGKDLVKHFGKTGVWLWGVANGLERIEVKEKPMRSLSAEHTFEEDVSEKEFVVQKLEELAGRLYKRVISANVKFRVIGIKVRFTHFQTYSRENSLPVATSSKEAMIREARNLFREFEKNPRKIRLIGLSVSGFAESETDAGLENWLP
jgi:DNA polymerase IV (DinB-like DNA polymerase)